MDWQEARAKVLQAAGGLDRELRALNDYLFSNPEVAYQEFKASARVAEVMEARGFKVDREVAGLPTALRAEWDGFTPAATAPAAAAATLPSIAFLAEYDALPGLGHACGHNLIAAMSVGAALACQAAGLPARILLFGTPAEEAGGGKVAMTDAGLFDGVDAALMIHPSGYTTCGRGSLAMRGFKLKYHGKPAHASGRPDQGINALEAAVQTYVSINGLRQHLPTDVRIHGIFSHGGAAPNIVPEYAELYYYVRALTLPTLETAYAKALACARGAAEATGARLEIEEFSTYRERVESPQLAEALLDNLHALGVSSIDPATIKGVGSSDIGNVSHAAPTIHAYLKIVDGDKAPGHTHAFTEAAGSEEARRMMLVGVKALALTAVDVVLKPGLREAIRDEFARRKAAGA